MIHCLEMHLFKFLRITASFHTYFCHCIFLSLNYFQIICIVWPSFSDRFLYHLPSKKLYILGYIRWHLSIKHITFPCWILLKVLPSDWPVVHISHPLSNASFPPDSNSHLQALVHCPVYYCNIPICTFVCFLIYCSCW